jgi:hypothetical protein
MTEPIFFEIPIYRNSLNKHTAEQQAEKDAFAKPENKLIAPESYKSMENYFHMELWYPWRYNEVIGYLNLFIMGNQFRADYWKVKKRRFNRGITKKKFMYYGKAIEKNIPKNATSEQIFELMKIAIIECNKHDFKNFHVDLSTFNVMGAFVDWKELTSKLNSFVYPDLRQTYFDKK